MITEKMPETEEREYIRKFLDAVKKATEKPAQSWIGVDYGESSRTVRLLAEQGVRYVCDWANNEQPYHMKVPVGRMVSLPPLLDLDDSYTRHGRKISITLEACHAKEVIEQAFARYGTPEIVNTDQGSQFTAEEFTATPCWTRAASCPWTVAGPGGTTCSLSACGVA